MNEIWRPIEGFEGLYEVSKCGKVRSKDREVGHRYGGTRIFPGRELKSYLANGYPKVSLSAKGERKKEYVHRLVAKSFVPNPLNLSLVNHIDGDKENPEATNLEWVTYSENSLHAFRIGIRESDKGERA